MAKRPRQGHRTEITVALIAMISAILVAFIANFDKIFPRDPPPPQVSRESSTPAVPSATEPTESLKNYADAEAKVLDESAERLLNLFNEVDAEIGANAQ